MGKIESDYRGKRYYIKCGGVKEAHVNKFLNIIIRYRLKR